MHRVTRAWNWTVSLLGNLKASNFVLRELELGTDSSDSIKPGFDGQPELNNNYEN